MLNEKIQVIDLGISNLLSIRNGLTKASDAEVSIITSPSEILPKALVVLPGTGNFGKASESLTSSGFREGILSHVSRGGSLFGVCLGMQLMFKSSEESPEASGLGLFDGKIMRLDQTAGVVPNVGWGLLSTGRSSGQDLFAESIGETMYFVHSYAFTSPRDNDVYLVAKHGSENFVATIEDPDRRIAGCQFHPEKSASRGIELISRVVTRL